MGDTDQHLVRAATRCQLDGIVEHRYEHVEPFDRELLLTDERAPEVRLEGLDLREALQEPASLLAGQRSAKATGLDRLAQPDALGVVGDVLDLVRDRARVDLAEVRERLEQGLAGHREPQQLGRNPSLQLGRQGRHEAGLVECRVTHRLRPERVEPRIQVPVGAVRLHQGHRRGHSRDELVVDRGAGRRWWRCRSGRRLRRRRGYRCDFRDHRRAVAVARDATTHEPLEPG